MKAKLLELLKTRFKGVDEKTLNRIATKLAKTVKEEAECQTAVDGVTIQELLENYGDARATEAQQTAVSNYETKHGLKDGKPVQQQQQQQQQIDVNSITDPNVAAMMQMMQQQQQQIQQLTGVIGGMQTKTLKEARLAQLTDALKNVPEALRTQYSQDFERMHESFKDDADFDTWLGTAKTMAEAVVNATRAQGGIFTPPSGGGSSTPKNQPNPYVQQRAAERTAFYNSGGAIRGLQPAAPAAPAPTQTAGA